MTPSGPLLKRCCRCKVSKPLTNEFFPKRNDRPSGLGYICKQCLRGVSNAHHLSSQARLLMAELAEVVDRHVKARLASEGLSSREGPATREPTER